MTHVYQRGTAVAKYTVYGHKPEQREENETPASLEDQTQALPGVVIFGPDEPDEDLAVMRNMGWGNPETGDFYPATRGEETDSFLDGGGVRSGASVPDNTAVTK